MLDTPQARLDNDSRRIDASGFHERRMFALDVAWLFLLATNYNYLMYILNELEIFQQTLAAVRSCLCFQVTS